MASPLHAAKRSVGESSMQAVWFCVHGRGPCGGTLWGGAASACKRRRSHEVIPKSCPSANPNPRAPLKRGHLDCLAPCERGRARRQTRTPWRFIEGAVSSRPIAASRLASAARASSPCLDLGSGMVPHVCQEVLFTLSTCKNARDVSLGSRFCFQVRTQIRIGVRSARGRGASRQSR